MIFRWLVETVASFAEPLPSFAVQAKSSLSNVL